MSPAAPARFADGSLQFNGISFDVTHERELAQQLQAVESTIHGAKRTLIHDHMEHCIGDAVANGGMTGKQALSEFKTLAKYL